MFPEWSFRHSQTKERASEKINTTFYNFKLDGMHYETPDNI